MTENAECREYCHRIENAECRECRRMAEKRGMQKIQSNDREDRMTTAAFQRQNGETAASLSEGRMEGLQPSVRGQNGETTAVCQRTEWKDCRRLSECRARIMWSPDREDRM